jgi:hypothetical protein
VPEVPEVPGPRPGSAAHVLRHTTTAESVPPVGWHTASVRDTHGWTWLTIGCSLPCLVQMLGEMLPATPNGPGSLPVGWIEGAEESA